MLCHAGAQVTAIFGFCDIRNFTDATEVLQEDIMEFVNSIAKIVHMEVSLHGGFPNKNIGDAFLLVRAPPRGVQARVFVGFAQPNIHPLLYVAWLALQQHQGMPDVAQPGSVV